MTQTALPTAVVTGGTRGLGYALSLEFARHGYRVLALYRGDSAAAGRLDAACAAEGLSCRSFRHDVMESGEASGVWSQPEITGASSIVLIHNASAAFEPKPLHLLRWEDFQTGIDVGLKGCWQCSMALLRPMLKSGGGTIVSVLTRALAPSPPKGFAAYLAAKGALRTFMGSLAEEYGARGLRVLTVSPGFMRTPLTDAWPAAFRDAVMQASPPADPAAVAARIRALVEDRTLPCRGENYDV